MLMKTSIYGLAALAFCMAGTPAYAQSTSGNPTYSGNKPAHYDPDGVPYDEKYFEEGYTGVSLALARDPALPPDQFRMNLSVSQAGTGCMKLNNPGYSTKFISGTMEITMGARTTDERNMPQYAHFECNLAEQESAASIVLGKQLLQENGVKKIRFRAPGSIENFEVKMGDNYIQLLPANNRAPDTMRFKARKITDIANPLKLWFYPENTVILTAEGADKDVVLAGRIKEMAARFGLEPLETIIPSHKSTHRNINGFYFIDTKGQYKDAKGDLLDYAQADIMKYGLDADEPAQKNVAVFIRKPGQYD